MIKQLLNSAIAKYRDLSVARRSIICLCLRHRQIIDLLATDKSRYFAQPRPIIVYYFTKQIKNRNNVITIANATVGLSCRPGKTCNTGNLDRAKTSTSSFPTKLLYYRLDDKTIDNTANRADRIPAFLFSHLQMLSSLSKRLLI